MSELLLWRARRGWRLCSRKGVAEALRRILSGPARSTAKPRAAALRGPHRLGRTCRRGRQGTLGWAVRTLLLIQADMVAHRTGRVPPSPLRTSAHRRTDPNARSSSSGPAVQRPGPQLAVPAEGHPLRSEHQFTPVQELRRAPARAPAPGSRSTMSTKTSTSQQLLYHLVPAEVWRDAKASGQPYFPATYPQVSWAPCSRSEPAGRLVLAAALNEQRPSAYAGRLHPPHSRR
jgi:hypothetical protein